MHTVWKGAISFGLVHVPVKMHTATEDKDISMRMIHKECGSPLSYVRTCPVCDKEVAWDEIIKGYEYEKGRYVLFDKEELEQLQEEANRAISIIDFVDLQEIDPVYYQKTYYLSPDQAGANAYQLLREALNETGKIGIAKVTLRAKSSLAAIRVLNNCLVMETMFYPDEIRSSSQVPNVPEQVKVNPKELEMAKLLISQLSTAFEPEKYTDEYRERLLERIGQKIAGEEVRTAPAAQPTANVVDLMAALQASIDAMKSPAPISTDTGHIQTAKEEAAPRKRRTKRKPAAAPEETAAQSGVLAAAEETATVDDAPRGRRKARSTAARVPTKQAASGEGTEPTTKRRKSTKKSADGEKP
ncbi:Ku protein [Paenibacillus alvei]|uniref:non-homologous end joining protein Ku n=1 Tax=Paenibacillus alvei TaxID=44250 RepID=UPI0018CEB9F3|nr:Ku protein [Paenibacillus alvei]MBG9737726.1 DNA repair protein [Paenibacillus alvei]MBG9747418.1 DNA repair protein [Paenibacillus alvei]MCY9581064.1 Ku protein [Paenibacillus alvei]MCY9585782.1 Ku protein [Paenibacillus alvei]